MLRADQKLENSETHSHRVQYSEQRGPKLLKTFCICELDVPLDLQDNLTCSKMLNWLHQNHLQSVIKYLAASLPKILLILFSRTGHFGHDVFVFKASQVILQPVLDTSGLKHDVSLQASIHSLFSSFLVDIARVPGFQGVCLSLLIFVHLKNTDLLYLKFLTYLDLTVGNVPQSYSLGCG